MNTAFLIGVALLWLVCGVLSYGWSLAYFQREFPEIAEEYRRQDRWFCGLMAVLGPFALWGFISSNGLPRHGFQWC